LISLRDVSPGKQREDALRRSNEELMQFAHIAAHDLQEPVRMVASYMELLAQRYRAELDERGGKYVDYAVDGARRLQRMIADLLTYSQVGSQGAPLVATSAER